MGPKTLATVLGTVLLAERGDKRQLAAVLLTGRLSVRT